MVLIMEGLNVMPAFLLILLATPFCNAYVTIRSTPISTIYQFARGSWLENLAIGPSDDSTLVTRLDIPALYQINLPRSPQDSLPAKLISTFPNATGLLGIQEYAPHAFAIIAGTFDLATGQSFPGSYSIWGVRFSGGGKQDASTYKITAIPEAKFLNGMTILDAVAGTILIGDSWQGLVYRLCTRTGSYEVVLQDETMKPLNGTIIGVNGIRKVTIGPETYLYFTNSYKNTLNMVKIDPVTGRAKGEYTTVALGYFADDLAYNPETGDVYVAGNTDNVILKVTKDGTVTVVAGAKDQLTVAGATSAVFGKGKDSQVLYVATGGAQAAPVNETVTEGGKLVALKIDEL